MIKKIYSFLTNLFKMKEEINFITSGVLLYNGKYYFFIRNNSEAICKIVDILKVKGNCILKFMPLSKGVVGVRNFYIKQGEEVVFLVKACQCEFSPLFKLSILYKLGNSRVKKITSIFHLKKI
jgi:DNA-binding transcriptional regulator WhiA